MQDPVHATDGKYSTDNWIIDQTEFSEKATEGHKRKKLFAPTDDAQPPPQQEVLPPAPKNDVGNNNSKLDDDSHKLDTRAAAFLGDSKKPRVVEAMEYEMNPMVSQKARASASTKSVCWQMQLFERIAFLKL